MATVSLLNDEEASADTLAAFNDIRAVRGTDFINNFWPRSTQRKVPTGRTYEDLLTDDIIEFARKYGRYGYRMVTGLLNNSGW